MSDHPDERGGFLSRFSVESARERAGEARARLHAETLERAGIDPGAADYDDPKQFERIQGGLIPGETLYAVYDMRGGGTGFVGITDRRVVIQDEGVVRKKRSLVSIPYGQIAMVAAADEGGLMRRTSALSIVTTSGRQFDLEFRSGDKAERAYTYMLAHLV